MKKEDSQFLDELNLASSTVHAPLWTIFPHLALRNGKHLDFLVESTLTHFHGPKAERYTLTAENLAANGVKGLTNQLPAEHGLSVCSDVRLKDGTRAHIPMMDFSAEPSEANQNLIITTLRKVGYESGILMNSGNSYHFYGSALLSEDEWRTFLGQSLLLSPITDSRYIAHRLVDGYCSLRILDHVGGAMPVISAVFPTG